MSAAQYYLICTEHDNPFVETDDEGITATPFGTEAEALDAAKRHTGIQMTVVRAVANVKTSLVKKTKVERFK